MEKIPTTKYLRLEGQHIRVPLWNREFRELIGVPITYLTGRDIDYSGRGYFFPRWGTIEDVVGREVKMDSGDYISFGEFKEIVLNGDS